MMRISWLILLCSCLVTACGESSSKESPAIVTIDLADIVGGGDGSGSGGDRGIDILTGAPSATHAGLLNCPPNVFVDADNELVDGVFCPDGGESEDTNIIVSSTGTTVTGVPNWEPLFFTENTWDHIWNGNSEDVVTPTSAAQIGVHANKGITFDLDAIEAAHGDREAATFTARAGIGSRDPRQAENVISFLVYVDGELVFEERNAQERDSLFSIRVLLDAEDRFLTLIASSAGDIQSDWSYWLAPELELLPTRASSPGLRTDG